MELLYAFLLASLILLHPCVFGGSGCIANNSTYSFCQIIGWTEWANCHSSCMGSLSVRNIMVCCVPNVTKDVCFSQCNISNTVISKEYGKIKYHYIIYVYYVVVSVVDNCPFFCSRNVTTFGAKHFLVMGNEVQLN